jgi:Flp pilus assembly protein TadD
VEDVVAQSIAAAGKAVDLDDTDSLAHEMLGIALMVRAEFESAVTELQLAIELNPSNGRAYSNLGYLLAMAGRPDDGIPHCERGLALNPHDPRNAHYLAMQALTQLTARRYDDAVRSAEKAVQRRTDNPEPYLYLAASLGHLGRLPEAQAALDLCLRIRPDYPAQALRWIKFKHEANRDHLLEGLRKAGWKD